LFGCGFIVSFRFVIVLILLWLHAIQFKNALVLENNTAEPMSRLRSENDVLQLVEGATADP